MAGFGRTVRSGGIGSKPSAARWRLLSMDPNPDYDATDEIEYFFSWLPWALRGTDWTGTPSYPPV
jgi:hypothetical protein